MGEGENARLLDAKGTSGASGYYRDTTRTVTGHLNMFYTRVCDESDEDGWWWADGECDIGETYFIHCDEGGPLGCPCGCGEEYQSVRDLVTHLVDVKGSREWAECGEDEGKKVRAHRDVLEELKMVAREVGMEQVEKGIHNHFMEGWGNFMEVLQRRGGNRLTRWKYDEGVAVENYDEE